MHICQEGIWQNERFFAKPIQVLIGFRQGSEDGFDWRRRYSGLMDLVLGISVAREYWRRLYPENCEPQAELLCNPLSREHACTLKEVRALYPDWARQLHCTEGNKKMLAMCFDEADRRISKQHETEAWRWNVPAGSFYSMGDCIYIASPEFLFVNAAQKLDFAQLVAYGDELCGLYSFDENAARGFRKRDVPITTKDKLASYVQSAQGVSGVCAARSALRHIVDRSGSPMETLVELLLCLPYAKGGYGLELPQMNPAVRFSPKAAYVARQESFMPDMYWERIHLDVEYYGYFDHSKNAAMGMDRCRVNGIEVDGIEVLELVREQVGDLAAFEVAARRIAKMLGKRIRKEYLGATMPRVALRRALYSWNRSSGAW